MDNKTSGACRVPMQTVAIINLKGGVGKSVTAINLAWEASTRHGLRVLVVDLDKQGNTTKFFNALDYDRHGAADMLTLAQDASQCVYRTDYDRIDIMPGDMRLLAANKQVMLDCTRPQQNRLRKALGILAGSYDLCLIDCPPDIDMATVNALVAADVVIIPVDCDEWGLDGLREIVEQVETIADNYNPRLEVLGCLLTKYLRTKYGIETARALHAANLVPVLRTVIRYTVRIKEAKAKHKAAAEYMPGCTAARDYALLADEVLAKLWIGNGGERDG